MEVEEALRLARARTAWGKHSGRDGIWGGGEPAFQHEYEFFGWKGVLELGYYVPSASAESETGGSEPMET